MLKKSLAALGFLTLLNAPLFSQNKSEKHDTLIHTLDYTSDPHLITINSKERKIKKFLKKSDEKTIENRLLNRIPSINAVNYMVLLECEAIENKERQEYALSILKNEENSTYIYGLTPDVKEILKKYPVEERFIYNNQLINEYSNILKKYISNHCKLWETKNCKEPSNDELRDLINEQGIVFIRKKEN